MITGRTKPMNEKGTAQIDETKVWDEDVRQMTYEDLMAAVRFLDQERQVLTQSIHRKADEQNNRYVHKETKPEAA